MNKKYLAMAIIIIFVIFLLGFLYLYFNRQFLKTPPVPAPDTNAKKIIETENANDRGSRTIPLEKPPFAD